MLPHANGVQSFTTLVGHVVDAPLQAVGNVSWPPVHDAAEPHAVPELPAGWRQPTDVSQASAVHTLESLQSIAAPLRQVPLPQESPRVQALPSSQATPSVADGLEHRPVPELHAPTTWHWSRAKQVTGLAPTQAPDLHESTRVQALASSHDVLSAFGTGAQMPVAGLHVPTLHWSFFDEQSIVVPFLQANVERSQVSTPSQALPLSQPASVVQPHLDGSTVQRFVALLQPSFVHAMESSQTRAGPPQVPFVQVSVTVQNRPSSQLVPSPFFGLVQEPLVGSQVPIVWHWSSAVHCFGEAPVHVPAWQLSDWVQAFPSSQATPLVFVGFVQVPPEQVPATWHWSEAVHVLTVPFVHVPA
jgi:hypothetical protein